MKTHPVKGARAQKCRKHKFLMTWGGGGDRKAPERGAPVWVVAVSQRKNPHTLYGPRGGNSLRATSFYRSHDTPLLQNPPRACIPACVAGNGEFGRTIRRRAATGDVLPAIAGELLSSFCILVPVPSHLGRDTTHEAHQGFSPPALAGSGSRRQGFCRFPVASGPQRVRPPG